MEFLTIVLQTNYEDLGLKSLLILTIVALAGVIAYLYKSIATLNETHSSLITAITAEHNRIVKEKDDKILQVIREHHLDIKENTKDVMLIVEKYHQFTQTIKELVNGNKG